MKEIYFTMLSNDELKKISILGALNANEESLVTHMIATLLERGIKCQRNSFNLNNSVNEGMQAWIENNPGYKVVPVNELFEGINFIEIPNIERD